MAISATGRANNATSANGGFTLLEVLVVLVIISVIIGFAVLSIDTGPEQLRREGNRLASLLQLTSEEAVMNGQEYRVVLHRHSYAFEQLHNDKWQKVEDEIFRPRQLPPELTLELSLENQEVPLKDEEADQENPKSPTLLILSSGECTPFELTVAGETTGKMIIRSSGSDITTS